MLATIPEAFERYDAVRGHFDPHEWRCDINTVAEGFMVCSPDVRTEVRVLNTVDKRVYL